MQLEKMKIFIFSKGVGFVNTQTAPCMRGAVLVVAALFANQSLSFRFRLRFKRVPSKYHGRSVKIDDPHDVDNQGADGGAQQSNAADDWKDLPQNCAAQPDAQQPDVPFPKDGPFLRQVILHPGKQDGMGGKFIVIADEGTNSGGDEDQQ